jgi:hypothetical protein
VTEVAYAAPHPEVTEGVAASATDAVIPPAETPKAASTAPASP